MFNTRNIKKSSPLTVQQHVSTIRKPMIAPAVPTTQVRRMKRITPKMFCMQGRYTPMSVPMRAGGAGLGASGSAADAVGIVFE